MCRWGCDGINSTFMCKWCGTRYCRECLKGEFAGLMRESSICAKCNQKNCQGQKVETVLKEYLKDDEKSGKKGSRTRSASAKRGKSASKKTKTSGKSKKPKTGKTQKSGKKKKKK